MKALDLFARAVTLVAGKGAPSRSDVETTLRDCAARRAAVSAEIERLAATRPGLLVGGSDADIAKHDALVSTTTLERDRADAIAAKLRERLDAIVAEDAAAERRQRRADVELQCELAAQALRSRYPKVVAETCSLLRTVATAQVAAAAFAKAFPDEPAIADPERVARSPVPTADKVLSEGEVWRWEYLNGAPLPDIYYTTVVEPSRRAERGFVSKPGRPLRNIIEEVEDGRYQGAVDGPFECRDGYKVRLVRKIRREIVRLERCSAPEALATSLKLPGLLSTDAGWEPERWMNAAAVLTKLEATSTAAERKPSVVVEYLPVDRAAAIDVAGAERISAALPST